MQLHPIEAGAFRWRPRGRCPVCKCAVYLNRWGRMGSHRVMPDHGSVYQWCDGEDQEPMEQARLEVTE